MIDLFPEDNEDRAVSPVIGVILMVAITVILAAVIGTFVLNLSGSVSQQASAGVTTQNSENDSAYTNVTVTSLGDNTDGVQCKPYDKRDPSGGANNPSLNETVTQVGGTMECADGDSVIAYAKGSESDVENKTIKTNIGG